MTVFKKLSKIKSSVMLALVSKDGEHQEYVVLRPSGRVTGTRARTLDLGPFTKKEKTFYLDMKTTMLFEAGLTYSTSKLSSSLKAMETYVKNNKLMVVVLAESVE